MRTVKIMSAFARLSATVMLLLVATSIPETRALAQTQGQTQQVQDQPPLQVVLGIVDFTMIMNESKAGKSLKAQADKQATAFEAEIKKQGAAFNAAKQKLEQQRQSLSKDDLQKKLAELNAQGKKMEDTLNDRKQALDAAFNKARDQIKNILLQIVVDIAKKRGMTLVLNKNDTVLSAEGFDFTDEAMQSLNEKLPSIKAQVAN